jgi:hypothetical protein
MGMFAGSPEALRFSALQILEDSGNGGGHRRNRGDGRDGLWGKEKNPVYFYLIFSGKLLKLNSLHTKREEGGQALAGGQ